MSLVFKVQTQTSESSATDSLSVSCPYMTLTEKSVLHYDFAA